MRTYKTRMYGKEIVLDVPEELNIEDGEEFVVLKGNSESIVYIPCRKNRISDTLLARSEDEELEYCEEMWEDL